jgi:hypothetical protein
MMPWRILLSCLALSGCQTDTALRPAASRVGDNSALSTMERVAVSAQKCWIAARDPAFRGLRLSPELSSYSGKPRILAVPGKNIGGLPQLVVEATGNPAKLSAYGPLAQGEHGLRLHKDIVRWAARDPSCAAAG